MSAANSLMKISAPQTADRTSLKQLTAQRDGNQDFLTLLQGVFSGPADLKTSLNSEKAAGEDQTKVAEVLIWQDREGQTDVTDMLKGMDEQELLKLLESALFYILGFAHVQGRTVPASNGYTLQPDEGKALQDQFLRESTMQGQRSGLLTEMGELIEQRGTRQAWGGMFPLSIFHLEEETGGEQGGEQRGHHTSSQYAQFPQSTAMTAPAYPAGLGLFLSLFAGAVHALPQEASFSYLRQASGLEALRNNPFQGVKLLFSRFNSFNGTGYEARFQLYPESLGTVSVKLVLHQGVLQAHFLTDTLLTKELIESQLQLLHASLLQQGLNVEKMNVSYVDRSQMTWQGSGTPYHQSGEQPNHSDEENQEQSRQRGAYMENVYEEWLNQHETEGINLSV